MVGSQGRLADSYDNMLQELSAEQEQLADYERILKRDSQMGDEAYKVRAQLESHKVSIAGCCVLKVCLC